MTRGPGLIGHRGEASHAFEAGLGPRVRRRQGVVEAETSPSADAEALAAGAKVEVIAVLGGARLKVRAL